ncbi:MAG TPA: hypothetical protein VLG12_02025 [Candidatus Saccharimonadales bacterium]|nr:hypothetical protein [Candidatus Saccharimonadales bacterium]
MAFEQLSFLYPPEQIEAGFISTLSSLAQQRDIHGARNENAQRYIEEMLITEANNPSEYQKNLYFLRHEGLNGHYTYSTTIDATRICLPNDRFTVLADVYDTSAKPKDAPIIAQVLSLETVKKQAPIEAQVAISQTLMHLTWQMQQDNPNDLKLGNIAKVMIKQLDAPKNLFGKKKADNSPVAENQVLEEQLQANLLHTLSLTQTRESALYIQKHDISLMKADIQLKIPKNKQELGALLSFLSKTERGNEARHEAMVDNTCSLLSSTTKYSNEYNDYINSHFISGDRDPTKNFLSLSLPRATQRLLESGSYQRW